MPPGRHPPAEPDKGRPGPSLPSVFSGINRVYTFPPHRNPANEPMSRPQKRNRKSAGFTLVELLIVMVILGLLSALVGPRLFGHLGASKTKAARTQIELLGAALDMYRLDMGRYPSTEEGIAALSQRPDDEGRAARWHGPYLKKKVEKDPWDNPYVYVFPGQHGEYDLISLGADGQPGGEGEDADINSWE